MKIDKKSWQKGYEAGLLQQGCQPENTEVLSWHAGFLEGQEKTEVLSKFNCQTCGKPLIRREAKKREKEVKNNIGGDASDSPIAGKPKFKETV